VAGTRRPRASGLITAKEPRPGRFPHRIEFACPFRPRPCGEITSGSGGLAAGPYQDGSTTVAVLACPSCAM
jgi:hypothetical protein